ncbi:MAG: hemerythrin domain-containing protein [Nocardioidaceae bacterium]
MAAELSMNQIIHAAVRRDVARTEQALRAFGDNDADRAFAIQRGWAHLVKQLTEHHQQEDAWVWPFLRSEGVDEELLEAMESEHRALAEALASGSGAIGCVVADPTITAATAAADVVAHSGKVIADHLEHEERDIEPVIHQHAQSPRWKAVERKFRSGGIKRAGNMMAWLQDGGPPQVRAALRQTIPPPVLLVLSKAFGRGYHKNVAPVWRG